MQIANSPVFRATVAAARRGALGAPSITNTPAAAPSTPATAAETIAAAEARIAQLVKDKEMSARWVALGLSGIASLFGIWRAMRPRCS